MRSPPSYQNFSISKVSSFDDRINEFWDEMKDHYNFIVQRTREYVNWRYCDPRGGDYIIKMAEADGKILGYSVLRINSYKKDYLNGSIVDLINLPKRLDVSEGLVKDAVNFFDSNNINIIQCQIIKYHQNEAIVKKFGFVDSRFRHFMHYVPKIEIDEELKKLQRSTANQIHYVYGDYDWL
jgi:hypothetical protein